MRAERRRALSWAGLALLVVGAAVVDIYVVGARNRALAGALAQTLVTVQTFALTIAVLLWKSGRAGRAGRLTLQDAAEQLAEQVRGLWEREAAARRLTSAPIPVRWRWSSGRITSSMADAVRGSGSVRFAPLPGMKAVSEKKLRSGALKDLLGVYGGLGSGRLVILGGPGSGKSGAAILLLLDALKHRASIAKPEERAQVPVPVLFTVHGWDPSSERLIDWLAGRLVRNNDFLRAPEYGPNAAVRLIEGGYVAVILDGLDELPEALRPAALRALDTQATFRLIVLTRSEEMVAAVGDGHLRAAAAIELLPVDPEQAADYLASCQVHPLPQTWQDLVTHLRQDAGSAVAQALDNPLMLTLARDVYGPGGQVDELTDSGRFPSREAVEGHLLDQVLPAAYAHEPGQPAPPYTADQAQQWLGYLAQCMNQDGRTRDLAWWQIPRWVPMWPRTLVIVMVLAIAYTLVIELAAASAVSYVLALLDGLIHALMFGLGLALVSAPSKPTPQHWGPSHLNATRIRSALAAGLVIAFLFGFTSVLQAVLGHRLRHGFEYGLVAGTEQVLAVWLGLGLGFVLVTDLGARVLRERRRWWNKNDLRATLAAGLAAGITIKLILGLLVAIPIWLRIGSRAALVQGLPGGLILALGYGFAVGLGRGSRQHPGQLQSARSILTAAIIGLTIAIQLDFVLGFAFIVVAVLGGRPPRQLGRRQWNRTDRRTTLVVGLVVGLGLGLLLGFGAGGTRRAIGLAIGLVFGLVFVVLTWLGQPSTEAASPIDPRSLWGRERMFGLVLGLGTGLAVGLLKVFQSELPNNGGLVVGLILGPALFLQVGLGTWLVSSATWPATLAFAQLRRRSGTPMRLLRFLADARDRQVLRAVGPVYQFRHARLQDRLAEMGQSVPLVPTTSGPDLR